MFKRSFATFASLALIPLILAGVAGAKPLKLDAPAPREVLGFEPGEDRKLADWPQIVEYFKRLDAHSARVLVQQPGVSTEGRPFIVAIISSEQNIANLARIRENQRLLADPRLIGSQAERERLIRETPAVVAITCSIHSTEIVASQMSMELAYRLATDDASATRQLLENTVLVLVPSVNPDGIDIVTNWYLKTLGTKFEGANPPVLYHRYTGHDNNRDWFMLTQVETQIVSRLFWREWFPEIVYDVHQQGQYGSRMCVPPFYDPNNPNIDPVILRQVGAIGMRMALNLTAAGFAGVVTNSTYDTWWHGGLRTAPYYHNAVGILTEAASARLATPLDVKREQLRASARGLQNPLVTATNFPLAWEGGVWRARDILKMELITCRTALEEAALRREELIRSFLDVAERAVEAGKREAPYAYVVPTLQHDRPTADRMINILLQQGVEVHRAKSDFTIDGKRFGAGSYAILLAQPYRANVKCLFEPQRYPDRRLYPGGPAEPPYDVAGWTLPMQMGVDYAEAGRPFDAKLEKVELGDSTNLPSRTPQPELATRLYLPASANNAFAFINELLKSPETVRVSRLRQPATVDGKKAPPGSFVIDYSPSKQRSARGNAQPAATAALNLAEIILKAGRHGVGADLYHAPNAKRGSKTAVEAQSVETVSLETLFRPRLALYRSWMASMDEGWTRWILEQFGFDYKNVTDADIRAGNLREKFDVVILPDQSMQQIVAGNAPGSYPAEYTGGITEAGVAHLRSFVEAGGVLVCLNSSVELAIKRFDLPVKNVLDDLRRDQFYAPGSIFRAAVETAHPLAYGMRGEADLYFVSGTRRASGADPDAAPQPSSERRADNALLVSAFAFEITDPARARSVARYIEPNPLRSGWLLGPEYIAGRSALVDVSLGRGRVVLFGFRTQHRAQTWGTFKFMFNSILLGAAR